MLALWLALACTPKDDVTVDSADDSGVVDTDWGDTDTYGQSDPTHLLVTTGVGVELFDLAGAAEASWGWSEIAPEACDRGCEPEGLQVDQDGVLAVFSGSGGGGGRPGGAVRLMPDSGDLTTDWEMDGFEFPHDVIRDPSGAGFIVAETFATRIIWVEPDAPSAVLHELGEDHPDWDDFFLPNAIELIRDQGRSYLLMCSRGTDAGPSSTDGRLVLWDITDPEAVDRVWVYPESGYLGMPHGPVMRQVEGGWMLVYAHTIGVAEQGQGGEGSLGVARTEDLLTRPTYLGDGILPAADGPLDTPRGSELGADGVAYLTTTGATQGATGTVVRATVPELDPPGLTGAWDEGHSEMSFFTFDDGTILLEDLSRPFEARLWAPTW